MSALLILSSSAMRTFGCCFCEPPSLTPPTSRDDTPSIDPPRRLSLPLACWDIELVAPASDEGFLPQASLPSPSLSESVAGLETSAAGGETPEDESSFGSLGRERAVPSLAGAGACSGSESR